MMFFRSSSKMSERSGSRGPEPDSVAFSIKSTPMGQIMAAETGLYSIDYYPLLPHYCFGKIAGIASFLPVIYSHKIDV